MIDMNTNFHRYQTLLRKVTTTAVICGPFHLRLSPYLTLFPLFGVLCDHWLRGWLRIHRKNLDGWAVTIQLGTRKLNSPLGWHTFQRLFPHGSWAIQRDKFPWVMGHATLYNMCMGALAHA
jgi:hypothetical protein